MKKCANCGKENLDKAIYCAECGFKLDSSLNDSIGASSADASALSGFIGASSADASASIGSDSNGTTANPDSKRKGGMKMWCCYVPVILFIGFIVVAVVYHDAGESFPISYGHTYEYFDVDGDGRLSLDEALQVNPNIPDSNVTKYFNEADTNHNGYLNGHEYELFYDDLNFYRKYYIDSSSSSSGSDKFKYSSSSSSSGGRDYSSGNSKSTNSLDDQEYDSGEGYVLTCPYCGSESVYETGGHYRCAACGSNIYNPDNLELGYGEGYVELTAPVTITIN